MVNRVKLLQNASSRTTTNSMVCCLGNHFVTLQGKGSVRLVSSGTFTCAMINPSAKIGFVYKLANAEVSIKE